MIDGYGRKIDYIRISVTDRCNLRCIYCMPETGIQTVPGAEILSCEEIRRLAEVFGELGIRRIRLTGGEPLTRRDLPELVKSLKNAAGIEQVTLTTNGTGLKEQIRPLAQAGIDGINLSLDTRDRELYREITGRDAFEKAWEGFLAALEYPEISLKINCVPLGLPGQNVWELAELARDYPVHVRYIELMPLGMGKHFSAVPEKEIRSELTRRFGEGIPFRERLGSGPARYYSFRGFRGKIGFISAVSHKFCSSCSRVRLTARGFLKTCLQYETGVDLKALLQGGAGREIIRREVEEAIRRKPAEHQFGAKEVECGEKKMMSQIGG